MTEDQKKIASQAIADLISNSSHTKIDLKALAEEAAKAIVSGFAVINASTLAPSRSLCACGNVLCDGVSFRPPYALHSEPCPLASVQSSANTAVTAS